MWVGYMMLKKFSFFLLALIFFAVAVTPRVIFSEETISPTTELTVTITSTPTPTQVEYELAYPGILPDSPLYFLKTFRDRVVSSLISDSLKKAEYNIVTSDKRYYAAIFLQDKNKSDLAFSSISKGNNYSDEALAKLASAKSSGKDINNLSDRMMKSLQKHEEVIAQLQKKAGDTYKSGYKAEYSKVEKLLSSTKALKAKK